MNDALDQRIIKFQACLDMKDIIEAKIIMLAKKNFDSQDQDKDYKVQIYLSSVGKIMSLSPTHKLLLEKIKKENAKAPVAYCSFKVHKSPHYTLSLIDLRQKEK